jgi:hypothetical protein
MKVKVNRRTIEIFDGAKVRQALLRYFTIRKMDLKLVEQLEVYDAYGHQIGLDSPLSEGQAIKFKQQ